VIYWLTIYVTCSLEKSALQGSCRTITTTTNQQSHLKTGTINWQHRYMVNSFYSPIMLPNSFAASIQLTNWSKKTEATALILLQIKHSYDLWEGKMDPCERPATSHHLSWLTSGSGFQRGVTLSPLCYIVLFTHKTIVTKMLFIKGKKTRQNGTNSCSVSRLYINITLRMGLKMKVGKL
jgi:hypothetical protein